MIDKLQVTSYKLRRKKLWLAAALLLGCAGCATAPVERGVFEPLSPHESARALAQIAAGTTGWQLVKYTMDCRFDLPETSTDKAATEQFTATCVWEPGGRLRLRARRFRLSVADVLFDGTHWYVTDEMNQRAYRTRNIARVRMARIPRVFFRQLQQLPHGWINYLEPYTVSASPDAYRLETVTDVFTRRMIVPRGSPLPSELIITTPDGSALYADISAPDTQVTPHAAMFEPLIAGYEFYDLDTGERLSP